MLFRSCTYAHDVAHDCVLFTGQVRSVSSSFPVLKEGSAPKGARPRPINSSQISHPELYFQKATKSELYLKKATNSELYLKKATNSELYLEKATNSELYLKATNSELTKSEPELYLQKATNEQIRRCKRREFPGNAHSDCSCHCSGCYISRGTLINTNEHK